MRYETIRPHPNKIETFEVTTPYEQSKSTQEVLGDLILSAAIGHSIALPLAGNSLTNAANIADSHNYALAMTGEAATAVYTNLRQKAKFTP